VITFAEAAVAFARRGLHVFQLGVRSKQPATRHGLHDATCDVGLVAAMWEFRPRANIGISCGPSNLLVVDVDSQEGAHAWAELSLRHGGRPRTRTAVTATGFHFLFSGKGRTSASRIGPKIDTRGLGGYIVAVPSIHPSGVRYRWLDPDVPILPAPSWLLELLERGRPDLEVGVRRHLPDGVEATPYGRAALDGLRADMLATQEGWRNDTLNRLGYRAGRLAAAGELDVKLAEGVLVQAAVEVGLPEDEAVRTYRSGAGAGLLLPTVRAVR
jgi:Bifunctional DNA primase/polymerase, N-terminal